MLRSDLTTHPQFSLARLEGLVSLEGWAAVLESLGVALRGGSAPPRLVIVMTDVLGYLGTPERRAVGALMARHLVGMEKVAVVVQAHKITDVVTGEARRLGLNLQLFPEYEDAVAWTTCAQPEP